MSAQRDLEAIYAADPFASAVEIGAGLSKRRVRGFFARRRGVAPSLDGVGVAVTETTLRVLAGSLGPAAVVDALLAVDGVTYRLLGLEPADGDGREEIAFVAKETP